MLVEEHNVGLRRFALIAAQWRFLWAVFRHRNSSKHSQRAPCFYYSTEAKAEGPLPRKFLSPDLHGLVCTEQSTHQGNRWKMSVFHLDRGFPSLSIHMYQISLRHSFSSIFSHCNTNSGMKTGCSSAVYLPVSLQC